MLCVPPPPFRDCICADSYLPDMSWYFGYPMPCSSLISIFCLLAFSSRFTGLLWSLGSARRETPLRHTAPGSCHPLANYKYEFNGHQAWVLRSRDTREHPHPWGFAKVRLDVLRTVLSQAVDALAATIWAHLCVRGRNSSTSLQDSVKERPPEPKPTWTCNFVNMQTYAKKYGWHSQCLLSSLLWSVCSDCRFFMSYGELIQYMLDSSVYRICTGLGKQRDERNFADGLLDGGENIGIGLAENFSLGPCSTVYQRSRSCCPWTWRRRPHRSTASQSSSPCTTWQRVSMMPRRKWGEIPERKPETACSNWDLFSEVGVNIPPRSKGVLRKKKGEETWSSHNQRCASHDTRHPLTKLKLLSERASGSRLCESQVMQ